MHHLYEFIGRCMEQRLDVLMIGDHGVGKTVMVLDLAREKGLRLKYYSAATLDPWADLVGIPVPVDVNSPSKEGPHKQLEFIRPIDIESAEMVFFDELNRSHPKVQNAVLEMTQFKSINGQPLPNLKMVWAAINPPDDIYAVTELDPVLTDRFHVHLLVPAKPSVVYYRDKAGIPEPIAKALVRWWQRDLDANLKKMISPRRLEYIGRNYANGIALEYSLPFGIRAPLRHLLRRLEGKALLPFELTPATLVAKKDEILSEMKDNHEVSFEISSALSTWPDVVARCFELFLALPSELQVPLLKDNHKIKVALVNLAREGLQHNQDYRALADRLTAIGISLRR